MAPTATDTPTVTPTANGRSDGDATATSTNTPTATPTATSTATATATASPTATVVACTPSTRSFVASADAFVNQAAPTTNSGIGAELKMRLATGSRWRATWTFTVTGLVDPVTSATLRLTTANYSGVETVSAPDVRFLTAPWGETTVTWATKPATGR